MAGIIISGFIMILCSLIMLTLGTIQYKSDTPVGFYSGEEGPKKENVLDMESWNRKHGTMWIVYGIIIIMTWIVGLFMPNNIWILLPYTIGLLGPIPIMIWNHNQLIKRCIKDGKY